MENWSDILESYPSAIEAVSARKYANTKGDKSKIEPLAVLEHWINDELPAVVLERSPPHLTLAELQRMLSWKLSRSAWRPKLAQLVASNSEDDVVKATTDAFSLLSASTADLKSAIKTVSSLKGVGPALGSAVLRLVAPQLAPYMSDEALALIGPPAYTEKQFLLLAETLQARAVELNAASSTKWTAADVEKAVWAHKHAPKETDAGDEAASSPATSLKRSSSSSSSSSTNKKSSK